MNMLLKKITIENFKSIKYLEVTFNDDLTIIKAMNGAGKTSIYDAYMWLLFDKMADGTQADKIRPHDANGTGIDFIEISVTADIEVDGKPINIIKVQKQKWTTPRGQIEKRFDGNYNEYTVNTIPKTQSAFRQYFDEIITESVFRSCSTVTDFFKMKPKDRRELLFNLVSGFSNEDVLSAHPELVEMRELLANYTIDELLSRNAKAIKEYNKKVEDIPTRIDEVNKQKVDIDVAEIELQKKALEEQIQEVEAQEESETKKYDKVTSLGNEIMRTKMDMNEIKRKANEVLIKQRRDIENQKTDAMFSFEEAQKSHGRLEKEIESKKSEIERLESERKKLGTQYDVIGAEEFDENSLVCPTCGQVLPDADKEEIRAKFEADKTTRRNDCVELAKKHKQTVADLDFKVKGVQQEIEDLKAKKIEYNRIQTDCMNQLDTLPADVDVTTNEQYKALSDKVAELEKKYDSMSDGATYRSQLKEKNQSLHAQFDEVKEVLMSVTNNSKIDERIEELKAEQKELAQLIADAEKERYLLEQFNKAKVDMITDKINKNFSVVKFRLFEPQINGGYKEICSPTINGTLYENGLNSGHRILADMDIINTMQKIHDVSVPVFLDNAERLSSNNVPSMDCQLVQLSVSDNKELVIL